MYTTLEYASLCNNSHYIQCSKRDEIGNNNVITTHNEATVVSSACVQEMQYIKGTVSVYSRQEVTKK